MCRNKFENNGHTHYVKNEQKLSEAEQRALGKILSSFPHANNAAWPKMFAEFKADDIPKNLLLLAANAYDSYGNTVLGVAAENGKAYQCYSTIN